MALSYPGLSCVQGNRARLRDCKPVFFKQTGAEEITYLPAEEEQAKKEALEEISDPEEQKAAVQQIMAVVHAFEAKAGGKKITDAYPLSAAKMGFWTKNGRWIFAGILLLVIAFFVWKGVSGKKEAPPAAPGAPANYPPANVPPQG